MENTNCWENKVRRVVPYTPGEQPKETDIIKLNTNENPFPPTPKVTEILKSFNTDKFRIYPDPDSTVLVEAIANRYGVSKENVFVGVGSDDVLSMAFLTFFNSDKPIVFPDITYSFYDVWAEVYNIPYRTIPLRDDFTVNAEDYFCDNGGVVIANPNAPTGVCAEISELEKIIAANQSSVVIIDEAYIDFGGISCLPLTEKYENLLVVQTFSKSRNMAGMRIGFAIGSKKLIKYMSDVKFSVNSYTMNPISQLCGAAAVEDDEYFRKTLSEIIRVREYSKEKLSELGFIFTDSKSNFLFAQHKSVAADYIFGKLKERKIYVRYWNKPRINNRLRITVGTQNQMDALFAALSEILQDAGKDNL